MMYKKVMDHVFDRLRHSLGTLDPEGLSALQNVELLKSLNLLTREGKLNQDARRKLKQIYHLIRNLLPFLEKLFHQHSQPHLVDVGAGKAYLGFILYDLIFSQNEQSKITCIEGRSDLIHSTRALSERMRASRMRFEEARIHEAQSEDFQMLTALHACDTATDDAIVLALKNKVSFIALVPCCQAEVATLLKSIPKNELYPLWRAGIHAREMGSHLTNVIRCLVLESHGYKVTATEFTGWEHSLKNQLILAEKVHDSYPVARDQLEALLEKFPIGQMRLLEQLQLDRP